MKKERNDKIDKLLQKQLQGLRDYDSASEELRQMGVKFVDSATGAIEVDSAFEKYLERFNWSNKEFEWVAEYADGTQLTQFDPGVTERHYGQIDQEKLAFLSFVSNFEVPSEHEDRRIIVRMDVKTGVFAFHNVAPILELMEGVPGSNKKPILFTSVRRTEGPGLPGQVLTDHIYNLGWESCGEGPKIKRGVHIEPNGRITKWK